jgi:hypothetical protein
MTSRNAFQIGTGSRGDVTILPTLVINNVQYRGWMQNRILLQMKLVCSVLLTERREMTDGLWCARARRETGADGGAEGRLRRVQGRDGTPRLPQPR